MMCGSMVDILSPTAEIRQGNKKEERQKKRQDENIMSASATQRGHNQSSVINTDSRITGCRDYIISTTVSSAQLQQHKSGLLSSSLPI